MFSLGEFERAKLMEWITEHDKTCKYADRNKQGACGGRLTYSFTPTGIGMVVKIECACGGECDVSDYDNW
jgi:hypothetical protein